MKRSISHVLLDIEGTTCPVSFVSDTLFPYAARELGPFLERHHLETRVQELVESVYADWQQDPQPRAQQLWEGATRQISQEKGADSNESEAVTIKKYQQVVPYLLWLISVDRKYTPLKELQGMVWNEGYLQGELQSTLFADVPETLQRWHDQALVLGVYSSGSVAAQKLLYAHSQTGDLRPLFTHWFDTHIGSKHEVDSYRRICDVMQVDPRQVLFISDSEAELQAASSANLAVVYSVRNSTQAEANPSDPNHTTTTGTNPRPSISSLEQINLEQIS